MTVINNNNAICCVHSGGWRQSSTIRGRLAIDSIADSHRMTTLFFFSETVLGVLYQPLVAATALLTSAVVVYVVSFLWRVWALPPGPPALPFIGNLLQLRHARPLYIESAQWSRHYGDPITVWIGPRPVVVVSSTEGFRDLAGPLRNLVAGRMRSKQTDIIIRGNVDVAFSDFTPGWDVLRRVTHVALRKYGQSDQLAEASYSCVDRALNDVLKGEKQVITQVLSLIGDVINDIIAISAFGGFDQETRSDFRRLRDITDEFIKELGSGLPSDILPVLGWIFYRKEQYCISIMRNYMDIQDKMFDRAAGTYVPGEPPRHFTDMLLNARDQLIAEARDSAKYLTLANLRQTVFDVFTGGTSTSRSSLCFALLHIADDPELQAELREEVFSAIGDQMCVNEDLNKLPKLQSLIQEVLRLYPNAPLALPRRALGDVTISGRGVPKDTAVFINLWAVNHDPDIWGEDADRFNAKRFLTATKEQLSRGTTTFGIGARSCPGEKMALADFTYVLTRFLQRVRLSCPGGPATANFSSTNGDISLDPVQQDIVIHQL